MLFWNIEVLLRKLARIQTFSALYNLPFAFRIFRFPLQQNLEDPALPWSPECKRRNLI